MTHLSSLAFLPPFLNRHGPDSLPGADALGVEMMVGVLGMSLGAGLIYGAVQILLGGRAQLRQSGSGMTLRESRLATRCGYVFMGIFLPSLSTNMLVLGIYADALVLTVGASLGLLITGGGSLFFFVFLFDRATHIDHDGRSVRRGRRVARLQDFHAVGVEAGSHSFRGRSYPFFSVNLLASQPAGTDRRQTILEPFQHIFSSKHEAKARAAAKTIADFTGLPLR